jgi:hypothetical protein
MNIELDDEAVQMIQDYEFYMGDESYANHLAHKVWQLYKNQISEQGDNRNG